MTKILERKRSLGRVTLYPSSYHCRGIATRRITGQLADDGVTILTPNGLYFPDVLHWLDCETQANTPRPHASNTPMYWSTATDDSTVISMDIDF